MLPCSRASICNRDNSCGMNTFRRGNVTSEKHIHSMNTHGGEHSTRINRAMKECCTIQRVSEFVFGPGHLSHEEPQVIHGVLVRLLSAEIIQRPHVLKKQTKNTSHKFNLDHTGTDEAHFLLVFGSVCDYQV